MAWYSEKGDMQDVVISTRVRFARNLADFPFPARLDEKGAVNVIDTVAGTLSDYGCERFGSSDKGKLRSYMEMRFVSPEFSVSDRTRALLSGENDRVKIMVCEEDHLRIQSIVAGFAPELAYEYASKADDRICGNLKIAYSEKYGYLTACPTNLGVAMRVSAMLCLPALTLKNSISSYEQAMSKMGITIRGLYGEGSKSSGCLYQISNRASLGIGESEILKLISDVVKKLVEAERSARKHLFELKGDALTDRIARSVGLLKNAHILTSAEFNGGFADIKMGLSLGLLSGITDEKMSEMLVAVQPATISMTREGLDDDRARDVARARLVRDMLGAVTVKHELN